ncbi:MAG: fructose-bisphosphate aldolase class I [Candidatus Eremiobacteraeota bacterium]|nr:fructose-bisphosphate aldolase class I [Candidatus Eremiobacteraeota bacterium]MBC5804338.1 fructose-bisphosphate aldolase class I [Candidatus Eremiobacteraeota bacterium]MBC5822008.1 fructose-bisphosphate aldolase class I [Candidatus Eremiobacteraeota bacterium]
MIEHDTTLAGIARSLVASGKGILAVDESTATCNKRFAKLGIAQTEEMRRSYRDLLLSAPGLAGFISGAILYDETLRQSTADGTPFVSVMESAGMLPGIKVDTGTVPLTGGSSEKITEGLDGLPARVAEYRRLGARFAKWRAVVTLGDGLPTQQCLEANAHALARYARLCQDGGLVPIVEPEVLMDGAHLLAECERVTEETLQRVFAALRLYGVALDAMILKPSMVIAGTDAAAQADGDEVARATVACLRRTVPAAVAGIAFLSGGQGDVRATEHLDAMNRLPVAKPWPLTFSYGRALQEPALEHWCGATDHVAEAQRRLVQRARCNAAAACGAYTPAMETEAVIDATYRDAFEPPAEAAFETPLFNERSLFRAV